MSFSATWLQLRAHADSRARDGRLEALLRTALATHDATGTGRVLDLGSGSGANCLHLAPRLDQPRDWCLIDNDSVLLQLAITRCTTVVAGGALQTLRCDLSQHLAQLPLSGAALLTGSALLDLVSLTWLQQLAQACQAALLPVLFTLSYDGRIVLQPADRDDLALIAAVNQHQRGDKGFGPALGPTASAAASRLFSALGYTIHTAPSDWMLDASHQADAALLRPLIQGWYEAASEQQPSCQASFDNWRSRRLQAVTAGALRVKVGHEDVLAVIAGMGSRRSQS